MKKFLVALCALALMASCREFEPVFTSKYTEPEMETGVSDDYALSKFGADNFTTIHALKNLYKEHGKPVEIDDVLVIRGEVTSSDESGNVYREIYIQDASGAIDFKIGRSSSYDDYKVGQILYINCQGLTLGEYGFKDRNYAGSGQLQLGLRRNLAWDLNKGEWADADDYETSYIDLEPVLRAKVLKGVILPKEDRIKPKSNITGAEILSYGYEEIKGKSATDFQKKESINHPLVSILVEMKNLSYADEVFALFYPNPNLNHATGDSKNRVFVSMPNSDERWETYDYTYGIPWWAMTKTRFNQMVMNAKNAFPNSIPFSDYATELDKTLKVYNVKEEEGGSTTVEEQTVTLVEFLESKGINDVVDLFASNPSKLIGDITTKVSGYSAKQAERIQLLQSVVSAIMSKISKTPGLKTAAEWYSLEIGSAPDDYYGRLGKANTDEEFFGVVMPYIDMVATYPSAQSVSQYFTYQGSPVAIRTSGYARFADLEIPAVVRAGEATIDVVGILGRYQGSPQLTMLDAWLSTDTAHEHSILNL